MESMNKIVFFCGFILLLTFLCSTVSAFDGRAVQYNDEGVSLSKLGRHTEAVALYDKALALEPNYADAWTHRGFAQSELGQYAEAVASYDKAIAINPDNTDKELWNKRGAALSQLGRYTEAVGSYDKAAAIDPYDEDVKQNREIARQKQSQAEQAQQQKTKATPLVYAPTGAIILMAGIIIWGQCRSH